MGFRIEKEKLTKKNIAILAIVLVLFLTSIIVLFNISKNSKNNYTASNDISKELVSDKTYKSLKISDIEIESNSSITHLMANIYNDSDTDFKACMVKFNFLTQDNTSLGTIATYLSDIKAKGYIRIDTVIDKKYRTAYTFKVEEN
jgi:hypothetical protein